MYLLVAIVNKVNYITIGSQLWLERKSFTSTIQVPTISPVYAERWGRCEKSKKKNSKKIRCPSVNADFSHVVMVFSMVYLRVEGPSNPSVEI